MTYVMADIHGQYDKYIKMLEKINFTDDDELYVIGDVVDRGEHPVKLLYDMSMRSNVFPILGNHDYLAAALLSKLSGVITEDNFGKMLDAETTKLLTDWIMDGGVSTLTEFKALSPEDREGILDYLLEFEPYMELTVGGKDYVMVHAGINNFSPEKDMSEYDVDDLIYDTVDYTKPYFKDKTLVTGHVPTSEISPEYEGKIYIANGHIAIDCGAGYGLPLGCIRLDDMAEFYVD
ncbi:MAG: metallophosphoesterase [Clostridia bacterium]|nr:metallophosphoesterase [Clostridia bacterium]